MSDAPEKQKVAFVDELGERVVTIGDYKIGLWMEPYGEKSASAYIAVTKTHCMEGDLDGERRIKAILSLIYEELSKHTQYKQKDISEMVREPDHLFAYATGDFTFPTSGDNSYIPAKDRDKLEYDVLNAITAHESEIRKLAEPRVLTLSDVEDVLLGAKGKALDDATIRQLLEQINKKNPTARAL